MGEKNKFATDYYSNILRKEPYVVDYNCKLSTLRFPVFVWEWILFSGAVGTDIGILVHYFRYGKNYSCEKEGDDFAKMQVNIGQVCCINKSFTKIRV